MLLSLRCGLFDPTGRSNGDMPGNVRSFQFPVTEKWHEYPALSAPITRLRLSHDDSMLVAAGEDGSLVIFEVCCVSFRVLLVRLPHHICFIILTVVACETLAVVVIFNRSLDASSSDCSSRFVTRSAVSCTVKPQYRCHGPRRRW
jgi:hypothetical protein